MIKRWKKLSEVTKDKEIIKTFRLPNGVTQQFPIRNEGNGTCILAISKDNNVILVRQFRPGPEEILEELPGGIMENGEKPADAASRELLEETGYSGHLEHTSITITSPYSNERMHNFVFINCIKVQDPRPDKNEFIEVVLVSVSEFIRLVRNGKMTNVQAAYIGLLHLGLWHV